MSRQPSHSASALHDSVCACHAANLLLRSLAILQLAGAAAQVRLRVRWFIMATALSALLVRRRCRDSIDCSTAFDQRSLQLYTYVTEYLVSSAMWSW